MNESINSLDEVLLARQLQTQFLGKKLQFYTLLDSTNEELFRQLEQNPSLPQGTTIFARQQTAGRGRQGNRWYSATEDGIYLSFLLRPKLIPEDFPWLTMVLGLGVAHTLERFSVIPQVKWPNDIYCSGKKVAGILIESRNLNPACPVFVAGIGINLNQEQFPENLGQPVISLKQILGHSIIPNDFCRFLLEQLESVLLQLESGDKKSLLQAISKRSLFLQKRVCVRYKGADYVGILEGFSDKLGLLVRLEDASLQEFPGEITTLREYLS